MQSLLLRHGPGAAVTVTCASCSCRRAGPNRSRATGFVDGAPSCGRRAAVAVLGRGGRGRAPVTTSLASTTRTPCGRGRRRGRGDRRDATGRGHGDVAAGRGWCADAGAVDGGASGSRRDEPDRRLVPADRWRCDNTGSARAVDKATRPLRPRSLLGAHLLHGCTGAGFVSVTDPPAEARDRCRDCRQHRCWPVLAASGRTRTTSSWCRRSSSRTTRDRCGERRLAVRLHRDRRDPDPAGPDDDRRGEGRGSGHRPAGRRDHRPQRRSSRGTGAAARGAARPLGAVPDPPGAGYGPATRRT